MAAVPTPTYGPSLRSLPLPGALGAPSSDDSLIARRSSFTGQGASAIVASGGETEAEAVLGRSAGFCGGQGPLGPLPQGLSPFQPHACLGQAPGPRSGAPPPPRFPRPAARLVAPARAGLPLGRPQPSSRARGTPRRREGRSRAGLREGSAPASVLAVPSPHPLPLLPRLLWALGQRPSCPRPPGQGPGPVLSGLAGLHPRTCLEHQGALLGPGVGGSWGPAREGAGPLLACFSCPFRRGAPSGPPLSLPFSLICRPVPPLGFLGWKKGPEMGGGGKQGPTQSLAAGPLPGGASRRLSKLLVPTPAGLVPNWKKGAFASL